MPTTRLFRAAARLPRAAVALALVALPFASTAGCETDDTTVADVFAVTSVSVDPEQFLGSVSCVANGMRRYVANLVDVTDADNGAGPELPLPSAAPTPCFAELRFERVVIGREYVADVQGYDRDDIIPLGCYPDDTPGCAGSSVMVDRTTGAYVAPRWTTSCGRHRRAPVPVSVAPVDGGPTSTDAGTDETTPPIVTAADAGTIVFGDCRARYLPDQAPWLEGPVCVQDLITIKVRGCDPLTENVNAP